MGLLPRGSPVVAGDKIARPEVFSRNRLRPASKSLGGLSTSMSVVSKAPGPVPRQNRAHVVPSAVWVVNSRKMTTTQFYARDTTYRSVLETHYSVRVEQEGNPIVLRVFDLRGEDDFGQPERSLNPSTLIGSNDT